jgi:hypothetical protein
VVFALAILAVAFAIQPIQSPKEKGTSKSGGTKNAATSEHTNKSQELSHPPSAPIISQISAERSKSSADHNANDVNIQRNIEIFTGVLAGVGVLQLVVMFLTWLIYRRQAREMRRQRHEMRRQRHVMFRQWQAMRAQLLQMESAGEQTNQLIEHARKQAEQLTVAAEAARNTAEAAKMDAEALVNSERAWVLVNRVGNPKTWYDPSNPAYTPGMIFELKVFGRTPGYAYEPRLSP